MTKDQLDTLTDAGLLEALRRSLSDDKGPSNAQRTSPRESLQTELERAAAAVLAEESE
jgi:hypothetical protein